MHDPNAPRSARLRAADRVLTCVKGTSRIDVIGARLWALHNGRRVAKSERRKKTDCATAPANEGASSCKPGHGAKVGRKKEQAIAALLTERNVEEAARATGIRATTLYRWLKDPEFRAEHLKARLTAFGPTGVLLQQAANPAATTIMKIMVDIATPAAEPFYCRVFRGLWRGGDSVMDEDRRHSGDIAAIRCSAKSASPPAHRNG